MEKTVTDQAKLNFLAEKTDPAAIIKPHSLRAWGKKFSFNESGEIRKIQRIFVLPFGQGEYMKTVADDRDAGAMA